MTLKLNRNINLKSHGVHGNYEEKILDFSVQPPRFPVQTIEIMFLRSRLIANKYIIPGVAAAGVAALPPAAAHDAVSAAAGRAHAGPELGDLSAGARLARGHPAVVA